MLPTREFKSSQVESSRVVLRNETRKRRAKDDGQGQARTGLGGANVSLVPGFPGLATAVQPLRAPALSAKVRWPKGLRCLDEGIYSANAMWMDAAQP